MACVMALAMLAISPPSPGAAQAYKYEGTWEGSLTRAAVPQGTQDWKWEDNFEVRLTFNRREVSVHVKRDGQWREIKAGQFKAITLDTNAVIVAIATGKDEDGVWVETWSFETTVIDATHLRVMWQRQVKNKDMAASSPDAVWGIFAHGELTRVVDPDA